MPAPANQRDQIVWPSPEERGVMKEKAKKLKYKRFSHFACAAMRAFRKRAE